MNRSGQALLIGTLLFIILMIAVPIMVFINRTVSQHGTMAQKKLKGRAVAEEGISFAMQRLIKPSQWPYAGGNGPSTGMPLPGTVQSGQGGSFALTYTSAPNSNLQIYQVGVLAQPFDALGKVIPGSTLFAFLSSRTVGFKLPTGYSGASALELNKPPIYGVSNSGLEVEWGPIVQRSDTIWNLDPNHQGRQRPRLISAGCITPRVANCTNPGTGTDQQEYWAFTAAGVNSVINLAAYKAAADNTLKVCASPICVGGLCTGVGLNNPIPANPPDSCHFAVPSDGIADFAGTNGYAVSFSSCAVFVDGNAQFSNLNLVVSGGNGGFIVVGNLILDNNPAYPASTYVPTTTVIPPINYELDDPYNTCQGSPCNGVIDRHIDMRGFLYVTGDVTTIASRHWTLYGVARIDGQLTIANSSSLAIFFNDRVNRRILTSSFEVQIDSTTLLP